MITVKKETVTVASRLEKADNADVQRFLTGCDSERTDWLTLKSSPIRVLSSK